MLTVIIISSSNDKGKNFDDNNTVCDDKENIKTIMILAKISFILIIITQ